MRNWFRFRLVFLLGILIGIPAPLILAQDSLSAPVSQYLSASDTDVAPSGSTVIVPGANNLLSPDDRKPVLDATKSDIFATKMNPLDLTSYVVGKTATQLDGSLKDMTTLIGSSGATQREASIRTNAISSFTGVKPPDFASSFSVSSTRKLQSANLADTSSALRSTWMAGSKSAMASPGLAAAPAASTTSTNEDAKTADTAFGTESGNASETGPLKLVGEEGPIEKTAAEEHKPGEILSLKRKASSAQTAPEQPMRDFSMSPLEKADPSSEQNQDAAKEDASPFKNLDAVSFLKPDIFSRSAQPAPSLYPSSENDQQQSSRLNRLKAKYKSSRIRSREKTTDSSNLNSQLDAMGLERESRSEQRLQRKQQLKWHNPILQEMEENASSQQ